MSSLISPNIVIFPFPFALLSSHLQFYELNIQHTKIFTKNAILCLPSTKQEFISMAQFINFMNEKQRDPSLNEILYPLYDEKRCLEIINAHEPSQENKDNSKS